MEQQNRPLLKLFGESLDSLGWQVAFAHKCPMGVYLHDIVETNMLVDLWMSVSVNSWMSIE